MLAPTTLLAEQHYQTLVDRFSKWPVKVAEVSRFRSGKEITAAIKGIGDGTVDIVVGTHKLLSEKTHFKNLGLLIIDEEHRFGVRDKERLKSLRAEVDVLTLTATPIPRTLAMTARTCSPSSSRVARSGPKIFTATSALTPDTTSSRRIAIGCVKLNETPGIASSAARMFIACPT